MDQPRDRKKCREKGRIFHRVRIAGRLGTRYPWPVAIALAVSQYTPSSEPWPMCHCSRPSQMGLATRASRSRKPIARADLRATKYPFYAESCGIEAIEPKPAGCTPAIVPRPKDPCAPNERPARAGRGPVSRRSGLGGVGSVLGFWPSPCREQTVAFLAPAKERATQCQR